MRRDNLPGMASTEHDGRRTPFEIFDSVSRLMLRMSLQALPVWLTIAASQYIGHHL
jgi:hypothetical protein